MGVSATLNGKNKAPNQASKVGSSSETKLSMHFLAIAHNQIKPDPNQPRKSYSHEGLVDLFNSIKSNGFLESFPLLVRKDPDREGCYLIVSGHRRWICDGYAKKYASSIDIPMPLATDGDSVPKHDGLIPCNVIDGDRAATFTIALVSNQFHESLSDIDSAIAYREALESIYKPLAKEILELTQIERIKRLSDLGLHDPTRTREKEDLALEIFTYKLGYRNTERVTKKLQLLNLSNKQQEMVRNGSLARNCAIVAAELSASYPAELVDLYIESTFNEKTDKKGNKIKTPKKLNEDQAKSLADRIKKEFAESVSPKPKRQNTVDSTNLDEKVTRKIKNINDRAVVAISALDSIETTLSEIAQSMAVDEIKNLSDQIDLIGKKLASIKKKFPKQA
jgi:ParB-like chromosome segregation protein Spo0J